MAINCLIVDKMHDSIQSLLRDIGVENDYMPYISRDEIKSILPNYNGLIIRSKTYVDADLLEGSDLLFVARAGAGIEGVDQSLLETKGIEIFNASEGNRDAVGEHTVGLILDLLNNISWSHNQVMTDQWVRENNRGYELGKLTVGIIGYGNSGSSLGQKLLGFGSRIIAYDKYRTLFQNNIAEMVSMDEIFEDTDILSLHIPLTDETRGLANVDFFSRFKKNIIFINTSRGEISPEKDILELVKKGKIIKAGLDVLEWEDFSKLDNTQSKLLEDLKCTGKVLFTPHIAGWTHESYIRINEVLVQKISDFLDQYNILK